MEEEPYEENIMKGNLTASQLDASMTKLQKEMAVI
jgi:hypothetical protein